MCGLSEETLRDMAEAARAEELARLRADVDRLTADAELDARLLEVQRECAARLGMPYPGDQEWVLAVTAEVERLTADNARLADENQKLIDDDVVTKYERCLHDIDDLKRDNARLAAAVERLKEAFRNERAYHYQDYAPSGSEHWDAVTWDDHSGSWDYDTDRAIEAALAQPQEPTP